MLLPIYLCRHVICNVIAMLLPMLLPCYCHVIAMLLLLCRDVGIRCCVGLLSTLAEHVIAALGYGDVACAQALCDNVRHWVAFCAFGATHWRAPECSGRPIGFRTPRGTKDFLGPHHGLMSKHRICCAPRGSRGSTGSRAEIGVDAVVSRAPLAGACGRLTEPVRSLEGRMRKRCQCHLNQLAKRLAQQELVGCATGRIEHSGLARCCCSIVHVNVMKSHKSRTTNRSHFWSKHPFTRALTISTCTWQRCRRSRRHRRHRRQQGGRRLPCQRVAM